MNIESDRIFEIIDELTTEDEIENFWFSIGIGRDTKKSIKLRDVEDSIKLFAKILKEKINKK